MKIKINDSKFLKDMDNFAEYTLGFLEGVQKGKPELLKNLGNITIDFLKNFIDSEARMNPESLHHVYEWYQTGSPAARLFDIDYKVVGGGLSFNYTFSQSSSISNGSNQPFYDKARIMEQGIPVTIRPKTSKVIRFYDDAGNPVFTKGPVVIDNPGGSNVQGGFEKTITMFFDNYFSQSYLKSSGILDHLKNPIDYKKNLQRGIKGGRIVGVNTGYNWVSKDFGGIE